MDKKAFTKKLIKLCGDKKTAVNVVTELKELGDFKTNFKLWKEIYDKKDGAPVDKAHSALGAMKQHTARLKEEQKSKKPIREKIALFGETSMGKTHGLLDIAKRIDPQGGIEYIIDTDDGVDKIRRKKFSALKNVEIYPCADIDEVADSFNEIRGLATPVDWAAIESLTDIWEMAQSDYTERVYGKDFGEFIREAKRRLVKAGEGKTPASLDGLRDWPVVKARHNRDIMDPFTKRLKCNVIATAKPKQIIDFSKGKQDAVAVEISNVFGDLGYRPGGEKFNTFRFDTCILLERYVNTYTCDKCKKKYDKRIRQCPSCKSREFTASYNYYMECFKDRGDEGFGRKQILDGSMYETYLKHTNRE